MNPITKALPLLTIAILLFSGCQKRTAVSAPEPFAAADAEYVLAVVLDMSGSFAEEMVSDDARAYHFFMALTEKFFRQRIGANDRILITQLSANDRTLLWEGSPGAIKRRFPDSKAFARFLSENSDPGGSRVYSALADTLQYVSSRPGVTDNTVVLTVVLSDLVNYTDGDEDDERARLHDSLKRYREKGGHLALYYVDQTVQPEWNQILTDAGFPARLWGKIVEDPALPEFDY